MREMVWPFLTCDQGIPLRKLLPLLRLFAQHAYMLMLAPRSGHKANPGIKDSFHVGLFPPPHNAESTFSLPLGTDNVSSIHVKRPRLQPVLHTQRYRTDGMKVVSIRNIQWHTGLG